MDIQVILEQLISNGQFQAVIGNPLAQFGPEDEPYLGATLLPEVPQTVNKYREDSIRYRTLMALPNARFSPIMPRNSTLAGTMDVELSDSDHADQLTGRDYEVLLNVIRQSGGAANVPFEAQTRILDWTDVALLQPLLAFNEWMRWRAFIDAKVLLRGNNNFSEDVYLVDPPGHRVVPSGAWSDNNRDPLPDILAGATLFSTKGMRVNRIVMGTSVRSKLLANAQMRGRVGVVSVQAGTVYGLPSHLSVDQLNNIFTSNELPVPEVYDGIWRDETSSYPFLDRDACVMFATSGRTATIDTADGNPLILRNTLGYMGVGVPTGEPNPGRVIKVKAVTDEKPYHIEGKAWQTSFPVIQDSEAIYVIKGIT